MMKVTRVLRQSNKSLALTVYFEQPSLGMQGPEILSRATAFLLNVDGKSVSNDESPHDHLRRQKEEHEDRLYKSKMGYSRAAGGGRRMMDLGWLEFIPREVRPNVHIVASSHVLSPFLWKQYYPQTWLSQVRQEHCSYFVEVFEEQTAVEKIEVKSEPFHHPENRDIALIHFREEDKALKIMEKHDVARYHFREKEKLYEKGEKMFFPGFVVKEPNLADSETLDVEKDENVDNRIFYTYHEEGKLAFHTEDRFFAKTDDPLPEGLCGGPVLDNDGNLCGTVEGIVPVDHENKDIAGAAAFMPSFVMKEFVDYVERILTREMMPDDMFNTVEVAKKTNSIGGSLFRRDEEGTYTKDTTWPEEYQRAIKELENQYTPEQRRAIMNVVQAERDEALEIFDKEGGDLDEILANVREKTLRIRKVVVEHYRKQKGLDGGSADLDPSEIDTSDFDPKSIDFSSLNKEEPLESIIDTSSVEKDSSESDSKRM